MDTQCAVFSFELLCSPSNQESNQEGSPHRLRGCGPQLPRLNPDRGQTPKRIPKVDPPILGSNVPMVYYGTIRWIYFLDPPRGLGGHIQKGDLV